MAVSRINLAEKFGLFSDHWHPRIIADVNDHQVKLARVQGEFVWHSHADEDEMFLVIAGELIIELRDGAITLGPGEMAVIPRGVEHRPVAREEVQLMLIEPGDQLMLIEPGATRHTGDVESDRTRHKLVRI